MGMTTKRGPFPSVTRGNPSSPMLVLNAGGLDMPALGYRKGVDDTAAPLGHYARARLPVSLHRQLLDDATQRRLTVSKLLRAILEAHYRDRPMPRVKANGATYAVARELNRIGVNLNQLTHVANATRLVPVPEINDLLAQIRATIGKL